MRQKTEEQKAGAEHGNQQWSTDTTVEEKHVPRDTGGVVELGLLDCSSRTWMCRQQLSILRIKRWLGTLLVVCEGTRFFECLYLGTSA